MPFTTCHTQTHIHKHTNTHTNTYTNKHTHTQTNTHTNEVAELNIAHILAFRKKKKKKGSHNNRIFVRMVLDGEYVRVFSKTKSDDPNSKVRRENLFCWKIKEFLFIK